MFNTPWRALLVATNTVSGLAGIGLTIIGALMILGKDVVFSLLKGFILPLLDRIGTTENESQVTALTLKILTCTAPVGCALLSAGMTLTLLSAIGYCGAFCNYKYLLYLFGAVVGVVDLALFILLILYYKKGDKLADRAVVLFKDSAKKYSSLQDNTADSLIVGFIQANLKCCGTGDLSVFANMSKTDVYNGKKFTDIKIPVTCCLMNEIYVLDYETCPSEPTRDNSYMLVPCDGIIRRYFIDYMNIAAYTVVSLSILLPIILLFAILTILYDSV